MRKVLVRCLRLVTEGSSVRETILLKPSQGGRRPQQRTELSSGSVIPGVTTRSTRSKVTLSKNITSILVAFQGTRFSLCLVCPREAPYLRSQSGLMTNPEGLPRGRWPWGSSSEAGLLRLVVNFFSLSQATKDRIVLFSLLLPIPFSTHLRLVRIEPSECLTYWLGRVIAS